MLKSALKHAYLPLAIAALVACDAPAGGRWPREGVADRENAAPGPRVMTSTDLRLQIAVERDSYLLGEPVYLMLQLSNSGGQAQRVFGSLDPSDGATEIIVSDGSEERRFVPLVETDSDETVMVSLSPGDTAGSVAPVFFGANGWTFPVPGRYSLSAVYRTPAGEAAFTEVRSAALRIEVVATGDGSGEFLVGESAASLEAGKFLTWQAGDHLEAGRAHLQSLLSRYPRSDLADYVNSALSRSYGRRFLDYRTRQVRPPNCELALSHLRNVRQERLPGFVRMQNALTRARCAQGADARLGLDEARSIARSRPEYQSMLRQITDLESGTESGNRPR